MSLLTCRSLSVSIGERPLCTRFDYQLTAGQCWGLLGSNGIGKTTLLHVMAGLRPADSGTIQVADRDLAMYSRRALARRCGILFQDSHDTFPATAQETVITGRHPHVPFWSFETADDKRIADEALELVALAPLRHRQVDTLSGGERRRLAIATILAQDPDLWLLDEPTNHLDLHQQMTILTLLVQHALARGSGILMVLHDVNLVMRFCSHVMLMIDHETILCGPVQEIINADNLQRLYQHPFRGIADGEHTWFVAE